ncbi:hypothetical protein GCM10011324_13780 [Allosediminivita pacifica]|nr:hypothetical protein GCM10011324_13780 [Allosediminivita pacifica]
MALRPKAPSARGIRNQEVRRAGSNQLVPEIPNNTPDRIKLPSKGFWRHKDVVRVRAVALGTRTPCTDKDRCSVAHSSSAWCVPFKAGLGEIVRLSGERLRGTLPRMARDLVTAHLAQLGAAFGADRASEGTFGWKSRVSSTQDLVRRGTL